MMTTEKIRVLIVNPMERPKVYYIKPTMKTFRHIVKANDIKQQGMQAKSLENGIYAIFNKNGLSDGLLPNRQIGDYIVSGTMLIVATSDRRYPISLADDKLYKYSLRFWNIETFDEFDVIKSNAKPQYSRPVKDE